MVDERTCPRCKAPFDMDGPFECDQGRMYCCMMCWRLGGPWRWFTHLKRRRVGRNRKRREYSLEKGY